MKKVYLIDLENVKNAGLEGVELLSGEDSVVIFYSKKADTLKIDTIRNIRESKAEVDYIKADNGTPNALDFQLITYLYFHLVTDLSEAGWKASGSEESGTSQESDETRTNAENGIQYWIISKDTGYEASIRMSKRMGLSNVHRAPAIKNAVHYGQRAEKSAAVKTGKNENIRNEEKVPASDPVPAGTASALQVSADAPSAEPSVKTDSREIQEDYHGENVAEHDGDKEVSAEKTADTGYRAESGPEELIADSVDFESSGQEKQPERTEISEERKDSEKFFLTPVPADEKRELAQIRQFPFNEQRESGKKAGDREKKQEDENRQQEEQKQKINQKTDRQKHQERQNNRRNTSESEKENERKAPAPSDNKNHSRRNRKDRRENSRFSDEITENQETGEWKERAASGENTRNSSRKKRSSRKNQQDNMQREADAGREARQNDGRKETDTVRETRQNDAEKDKNIVSETRQENVQNTADTVNETGQNRIQKEKVSGSAEKSHKDSKQDNRRSVNQALASFLHHKCSVSSDDATVNLVEDALKSSENKSQFYQYFRRRMGAATGSDFYRSIRDQFAAMKEVTGSSKAKDEPLEDQQRA